MRSGKALSTICVRRLAVAAPLASMKSFAETSEHDFELNSPEEVVGWILRNRKEDRRIEIKRSIEIINVDMDEVEKDSVAVANSALPESFGWMVFGIDKSYDILGTVDLTGRNQLTNDVVDARSQQYSQIVARINPPLGYEWCDFPYSNKRLIAVKITSRRRGHWHQTSKGGIFHRLAGHTYAADERIIRTWMEERATSIEEKTLDERRSPNVNDVLEKIHSRKVPLSECFVDALKVASSVGDHELESFCRHELNGWNEKELFKESSSYRRLEAYLSVDKVNTSYIGWNSAEAIMNFMMRNPDRFTPKTLAIAQPISKIEAALPSDTKRDSLATITMPLAEFVPKSGIPKSIDPDRSFVFAYATTTSFKNLIESIRVELSRRLLELTDSKE